MHEVDYESFIVDSGEDFSGDFIGFEEMMEVGESVVLAELAGAGLIERGKVIAIFGIFDVDAAGFRVEGAVSCEAGRADAVEGVATIEDAKEKVARFAAHAEKMARFFDGEDFVGELDDCGGFRGFSCIEAADAEAVDGLVFHKFGGSLAKIGEEAALDNSVEGLIGF